MSKKVLLTGGSGFSGTNLIKYLLLKYPEYKIINFDKLTVPSSLSRLKSCESNPNYTFVEGDVVCERDVQYIFEEYRPDYVIHLAAHSYIDRNIDKPDVYIQTNVIGTQNLITNIRNTGVEKLIHISTSKVYGSHTYTPYIIDESTLMKPCDPYSA